MPLFHQKLAQNGRWFALSLMEQLGHVGSEVDRALHAKARGDIETARRAIDRGLELIDITVADPRWRGMGRVGEILRAREVLCDLFYGSNEYRTDEKSLQQYFLEFACAARKDR